MLRTRSASRRATRVAAILAAAAAALPLIAAEVRADPVRVVVGFHGSADEAVFARHGGRADTAASGAVAGYVAPERLRALGREPGVAFVEEDLVRQASDTPNDPLYATQQADDFGLIGCPAAWDVSKGDNIVVAVLDTGCQTNHPDLSTKIAKSRNFTNKKTADVTDKDGHGTHTAGTAGARTHNGAGVAGAGYNAKLAIGKVLGPSGAFDSWIAAGIDWARQTSPAAKVVSMSLGGPGTSAVLENAIDNAWANHVILVAAAGNDGANQPEGNPSNDYPAASPNCISVAAVNSAGTRAGFSNYGTSVDIAAPGVNISSTYKGSRYVLLSGTSMATPHVAGVAALVWATAPGATGASVRARLEDTATLAVTGDPVGNLRVLDAHAAVTAAP